MSTILLFYCKSVLFLLYSTMIPREITNKVLHLSQKFPVVSITGPRQAGKTTLIKNIFPNKPYVSLEDPDFRLLAQNDPRGFLQNYKDGAIFDEVQRVPELFSYIQTIVDESQKEGQFILSGSQSFLLHHKISQSLAGRIAIFILLPFSITELTNVEINFEDIESILFKGNYPRIYDKNIHPLDYYPNYVQTYLERDVRQLQNIQHLDSFTKFLRLCAGRVGQLLNLSSLANDCGISVNTVKSWLSVLEASYVIFLLRPHHKNFNKRLVKMPKLYFYDTGLVCYLLGLENHNQLKLHYLKGGIFESFIISELIKYRFNFGLQPNCYFWRDSKGIEIDCIIETPTQLIPIEIKSGKTVTPEYFKTIEYWNKISKGDAQNSYVVYGGDLTHKLSSGLLISWRELTNLFNFLYNHKS